MRTKTILTLFFFCFSISISAQTIDVKGKIREKSIERTNSGYNREIGNSLNKKTLVSEHLVSKPVAPNYIPANNAENRKVEFIKLL